MAQNRMKRSINWGKVVDRILLVGNITVVVSMLGLMLFLMTVGTALADGKGDVTLGELIDERTR